MPKTALPSPISQLWMSASYMVFLHPTLNILGTLHFDRAILESIVSLLFGVFTFLRLS